MLNILWLKRGVACLVLFVCALMMGSIACIGDDGGNNNNNCTEAQKTSCSTQCYNGCVDNGTCINYRCTAPEDQCDGKGNCWGECSWKDNQDCISQGFTGCQLVDGVKRCWSPTAN